MRLAAMIVCSATVLFLVACASSTTSTPEEDSASGVEVPENEYGVEVIEDKTSISRQSPKMRRRSW